jgi:hypothetical protein
MPAEPLFIPETPQIPALGDPHLDKQLKLNSFITAEEEKNIFLPAEPLILPETLQVPLC